MNLHHWRSISDRSYFKILIQWMAYILGFIPERLSSLPKINWVFYNIIQQFFHLWNNRISELQFIHYIAWRKDRYVMLFLKKTWWKYLYQIKHDDLLSLAVNWGEKQNSLELSKWNINIVYLFFCVTVYEMLSWNIV